MFKFKTFERKLMDKTDKEKGGGEKKRNKETKDSPSRPSLRIDEWDFFLRDDNVFIDW